MFLMALGIRGTFGFADYELGGGGGLDADSHFGFWIYYHLLFLYSRIFKKFYIC